MFYRPFIFYISGIRPTKVYIASQGKALNPCQLKFPGIIITNNGHTITPNHDVYIIGNMEVSVLQSGYTYCFKVT